MNIDQILGGLKQVLKNELMPVELPKACPFFQTGEVNHTCKAVSGWISQDAKDFCENEFPGCDNYAKGILKDSLTEKFFIGFLIKECVGRVPNFVISGTDMLLKERLEEFFTSEFKLKKSIPKEKVSPIFDEIERLSHEKEEGQGVLARQRTKHARHTAKRRVSLNANSKLLSQY